MEPPEDVDAEMARLRKAIATLERQERHELAVGDQVERRSGAEPWGVGFVVSLSPLTVTVSSTNPSAQGYTWDDVRPLSLSESGLTLTKSALHKPADLPGYNTPPGGSPTRRHTPSRSKPIDDSPSPPGGRGKMTAGGGGRTPSGGRVQTRLFEGAAAGGIQFQFAGAKQPTHYTGPPPGREHGERWDQRKQTISNVLEVMHPDDPRRGDPNELPVDEHRYTGPAAVVGPLGAGPTSPSPRLIVKPIDTSYAVITVAVYSDKNPVFHDERGHKVQPGLPKTKEWGELSAYFRSKAELLGLTTEAAWDTARRGDLARTKSKDHTDAANVLGFNEKSPYQDDPAHPVDDRRFHWASILNAKMAVVQAEGTFGWQHVVYNALEPELKAEFHDPTEVLNFE